jgi:hypothetical protein
MIPIIIRKVTDRLSGSKGTTRKFDKEKFSFKKISKWKVKNGVRSNSKIKSQVC